MSETRATILGFAAASIVPPLLMALATPLVERGIEGLSEALELVAVAFLLFLPFSLLSTVIIGVPVFLVCRRLGIVTWWLALVAGASSGALVAVVRPANQPVADVLLGYVLCGSTAGLVFWLVWRRGTTNATT